VCLEEVLAFGVPEVGFEEVLAFDVPEVGFEEVLALDIPEVCVEEVPPDLPVKAVLNAQVAGRQLCASLHSSHAPAAQNSHFITY
jgi:hypothetical protein